MMRFLVCALALICGTAFAIAADGPSNQSTGSPTVEALFDSFTPASEESTECECGPDADCGGDCGGDCDCEPLASHVGPPSPFNDTRLRSLEARVSELERTSITASDAERIAEMVVDRRIREIRLAINTADGGQRIEKVSLDGNQSNGQRSKTVQFSDGSTMSITLQPGETLASVTDPVTGQVHTFGEPTRQATVASYSQPVPSWQTPYGEFRAQPRAVSQPRRVQWRAVGAGNCSSGSCGF